MALKISNEVRDILNDPSLIAARDQKMKKLSEFFENPHPNTTPTVETVPYIWGDNTFYPGIYGDPEEWMSFALTETAKKAHIINDPDPNFFKPVCLEYYAYGVHYIDKMLGADVFFMDDQIYNRYLKTPVGELQYPDLNKDPLWQHTMRATEAFLEADVKYPMFGLPTIASALNIAVNLYSEDFLVAMLEDPDAAKHDLDVITRLLCDIHTYFRKVLPPELLQPVISSVRTQPIGCGQICGCTTQLISGDLYEEFIKPCDEAVLNVYPNPGMIHLCGSHAQHIPYFKDMSCLHAVQVNDRASEDLELYFKGLRDDQIIYMYPCQNMPVSRAIEITGGHRLIVCWYERWL